MARRVFYSFHYKGDCDRAAQIRNMGVVEGNRPAHDNDWESIKRGGDAAIKKWIDDQMFGKSCTVVLIGSQTAGRKWINYEIRQSWIEGKGLLGIHIHGLKNLDSETSFKGANPFEKFTIQDGSVSLASVVPVHEPPFFDSRRIYAYIKENLADWVDEACRIRSGV